MLQTELAFYIGCLNLHRRLLDLSAPFTFPTASDANTRRFSSNDLYDICLALELNKRPVGNEVEAGGKSLLIVTGANQGGKTTFLRSVGLAQLMTQCGMFAPAASLRLNIVNGLFTHFKREEDVTMKSGKFDEELSRMNAIVNTLTPNALDSLQRVVRRDQRAGGVGNCAADRVGLAGTAPQNRLHQPPI